MKRFDRLQIKVSKNISKLHFESQQALDSETYLQPCQNIYDKAFLRKL